VLQKFAEVLRGTYARFGHCGRMGGEEFVMVLTHVDRNSIVPTVDRLREQFASLVFRWRQEASVTSSFGIRGLRARDIPSSFIYSAGGCRALCAKHAGRNRVELAAACAPGTFQPPKAYTSSVATLAGPVSR